MVPPELPLPTSLIARPMSFESSLTINSKHRELLGISQHISSRERCMIRNISLLSCSPPNVNSVNEKSRKYIGTGLAVGGSGAQAPGSVTGVKSMQSKTPVDTKTVSHILLGSTKAMSKESPLTYGPKYQNSRVSAPTPVIISGTVVINVGSF